MSYGTVKITSYLRHKIYDEKVEFLYGFLTSRYVILTGKNDVIFTVKNRSKLRFFSTRERVQNKKVNKTYKIRFISGLNVNFYFGSVGQPKKKKKVHRIQGLTCPK